MKERVKAIIPALLLITAMFYGGWFLYQQGKDAVTVYDLKRDSLLAAEQFNVSFQQVGGRVTEVLVREGQYVEQGTVLMRLDPQDLDTQIRALETQIATVNNQIAMTRASIQEHDLNIQKMVVFTGESNLAAVEKNYERIAFLFEEGAATAASLEEAELRVTVAENALTQSKEALQKIENAIAVLEMNIPIIEGQRRSLEVQRGAIVDQKNRMVLTAPVGGVVLRVTPKAGENVAPNAPVVVLQSRDLYFDIYVPETVATRFTPGTSPPIRLVTTGEELSGVVQYILNAPQYTSNRMSRDNAQGDLASFQVRIALKGDTSHLLPGMTVEVDISGAD